MSNNQEIIWDNIYRKEENKWKLETPLPEIFKNKSILELGVGNGKTLSSILNQKPKSVSAIDFSQESITIIKKKYPSVDAIKSNLLSLPFKENSFDIVVCSFILNNLKEKEIPKAISEIDRVLKSKGNILFSDFGEGDYRIKEKREDKLEIRAFSTSQVKELFSKFNIIQLETTTTSPIRNKPSLKRKRIFMLAKKI